MMMGIQPIEIKPPWIDEVSVASATAATYHGDGVAFNSKQHVQVSHDYVQQAKKKSSEARISLNNETASLDEFIRR
ncbi:unnamed protein product [Somion occarium]|uniref:Uncharacterized protein n=1 Tax=Somion occarium TaxID=3059160 RepID=A0ABP1DV52_9APHY